MKLVHVIHCCNAGGAEVFVKNLVEKMKDIDKNIEIQLWAVHDSKKLYKNDLKAVEFEEKYINELEKHKIRVKRISKTNGFMGRINMMIRINSLFNQFHPDVIHCHLESVTFNITSSLFFRRVKIYETIHNSIINKKYIHRYFLNFRIKKYVSIAKCVSSVIKRDLKVKDSKVVQIYNGIDVIKYDITRNVKEENISIIAVGRLTKQKNHILLLQAYKQLIDKCKIERIPIPELKIYGTGNLESLLQNYIYENNLEKCKLMGTSSNIPEILKQNQIYVMSSDWEGLSISLIEAKVSGISIICTDVGGNNEIIDNNETGILVKKGDVDGMARGLFALLTDKKMREKFYKNTKKEKNFFSIEQSASMYLQTYKF